MRGLGNMRLIWKNELRNNIRGNVEDQDGDMKEWGLGNMRLIWKNNGAAPVDSLEVGCRPARPALGEVPGPGQTHLMAQFYFLPLTLTRGRQEIGNTWLGGRDDKDTDKEDKESWEDTKRKGRNHKGDLQVRRQRVCKQETWWQEENIKQIAEWDKKKKTQKANKKE